MNLVSAGRPARAPASRETASQRPWRPLLTGRTAAEAWRVVDAIASELREWVAAWPARSAAIPAPFRASVDRGAAGLALFFAYRAAVSTSPSDRDLASSVLRYAFDALPGSGVPLGLLNGLAGVGWVAAHLERAGYHAVAERELRAFDDVLLEMVRVRPWPASVELGMGLTGIGLYAAERLPSSGGRRLLRATVAQLDALATHDRDGARWLTPSHLYPEHRRASFPDGRFDLGLAHGASGVVVLLAAALRARIGTAFVGRLLTDAVQWLHAQKHPDGPGAWFPEAIIPGVLSSAPASRLAWCYGDVGVAVALDLASRASGDPDWGAAAHAIARHAAGRSVATSLVDGPEFCHGASGVAHALNRLSVGLDDQGIAAAATRWFEITLAYLRERPADTVAPLASPVRLGLLGGSIGIGLALLAAVSDQPPTWDRFVALSSAVDAPGPTPSPRVSRVSRHV